MLRLGDAIVVPAPFSRTSLGIVGGDVREKVRA
jgi:hypothetical protein